MNIVDFLEKVKLRIAREGNKNAEIFLISFLSVDTLKDEVGKRCKVPEKWWLMDITNNDDWQNIYIIAAELLWSSASANSSEVHPDIFEDADAVSKAFCEELSDLLEVPVEHIVIESMAKQMERSGLVSVKDGMVQLTPEGKDVAESTRREIEGGNN